MRINTHARSHYRYYECNNHAVLKTCSNRCRYRVDVIESAVLSDLRWLSVRTRPPATVDDIPALTAELEKLQGREKRLESRFQTLDDDDLFDVIRAQLRELRSQVSTAKAKLAVAQRAVAIAHAVVPTLAEIADRGRLHTALRARIKRVTFNDENEVRFETAGILLVVHAVGNGSSKMCISNGAGKVAWIADGSVSFSDGFEGMPNLDRDIGADLLRYLAQSTQ